MAMRISRARLARPLSGARQAMRGSGARRNTTAQKRTVRTRASEEPQRAAALTLDMLLTTLVAIVGIIGGTVAIINPSLNAVKTELTASIKELTISNNANIKELTTSNNAINKELTAISNKLDTYSSKLDAVNEKAIRAQSKVEVLQGIVTDKVTVTPTPTKK